MVRRDHTSNHDAHYCAEVEDLRFAPGVCFFVTDPGAGALDPRNERG